VRTFDQPLPEEAAGEMVFDDLAAMAPRSLEHRQALSYVVGSGEPIAARGGLYASVLNQNATAWRSAPSAVTIERTVVSNVPLCGGSQKRSDVKVSAAA